MSSALGGLGKTMIEEAKSVAEAIQDRLRSPWFGIFAISWVLINWKMLLLLFMSKKPIEEIIASISTTYYSIENWILFPVLISLAYLVVSPAIGFLAFIPSQYFHVKKHMHQRKSEISLLKLESELKFRKREVELIESERFEGLSDYASKKSSITNE